MSRRSDTQHAARDIRHSFRISASPADVAAALSQAHHLRRWWTREAEMAGDEAILRWSGHGFEVRLRIEHDRARNRVLWHCSRSNMQGTAAWEGTTIRFELDPDPAGTRIGFTHSGYADSPCRDTCEQGWAFFVGTSLKRYLETGTGIPYPDVEDSRTYEGGDAP